MPLSWRGDDDVAVAGSRHRLEVIRVVRCLSQVGRSKTSEGKENIFRIITTFMALIIASVSSAICMLAHTIERYRDDIPL